MDLTDTDMWQEISDHELLQSVQQYKAESKEIEKLWDVSDSQFARDVRDMEHQRYQPICEDISSDNEGRTR